MIFKTVLALARAEETPVKARSVGPHRSECCKLGTVPGWVEMRDFHLFHSA